MTPATAPAAPDALDHLAKGWRAYVLVALIGLASILPGFFRVPPIDRDEARFAQATVQMLETGDYVHIYNQDEVRHKKPIGIYWLQAVSVKLTSSAEAREIWAYRLPSLLGILVAAMAALWAGTTLVGRRAALLGAGLFAACLIAGFEGRSAKTDAVLCACVTLAIAALVQLHRRRDDPSAKPNRTMTLLFWGALGVGILVKGPIAPMVLGLGLVALGLWERRWLWMRRLFWWPGPALAAAVALPWLVAIGIATQGAFFAEAIGNDLGTKLRTGDEGHSGLPGYHLALLPLLLFPASIGLIPAVRQAVGAVRAPRAAMEAAPMRLMLALALPSWLVFEATPTKLPHYPMVVYPVLALLCGAGLVALYDGARKARVSGPLLTLGCGAVLAVLAGLASLYLPGDEAAGQRRMVQAVLLGGALTVVAVGVVMAARRPALAAAAALAVALGGGFTFWQRIAPEMTQTLVSSAAVEAVAAAGIAPDRGGGGPPLLVVGFREPSFVFLTRTDSRLLGGAAAAAAAAPGQAALVNGADKADRQNHGRAFAEGLAARGLTFAPLGPPVEGVNYANGEKVSLQPGRVIADANAQPL